MDNAAGARTSHGARVGRTHNRASLSRAKDAWFAGDFERCLELCAAVRTRSARTAYELILMRARALLRLHRAAEAEVLLRDIIFVDAPLDEALTAQMLFAMARIWSGDAPGGLEILEPLVADAESAHPTLRSEIAFAQAFAYWTMRDLVAAEVALDRIASDADIVTARALNLRGWCALSDREYRTASTCFLATVDHLQKCRAQDHWLAATSLTTTTILAAELFDTTLLRETLARLPMIAQNSGTSTQRCQIALHRGLYAEMAADTIAALNLVREAEVLAPNVGYRILAIATHAAICRNAGELLSAAASIEQGLTLVSSLDLTDFHDEDATGLLWLAEQVALEHPDTAIELFERYRNLGKPSARLGLAQDIRLVAYEKYIDGLIQEAVGKRTIACNRYREAFRIFRDLGYVRRAAIVALRLIELTGEESFLQYVERHGGPSENWLQQRLRTYRGHDRTPLPRQLTKTETLILQLICEGKSNDEIAHIRNRHPQTIANMISEIFLVFGVSRRATLISACIEHNLYPTRAPMSDVSTHTSRTQSTTREVSVKDVIRHIESAVPVTRRVKKAPAANTANYCEDLRQSKAGLG